MRKIPLLISKTKFLAGVQCLKNVYLQIHHKELIPKVTPELQAIFDQGHDVGLAARKQFSDGVLIDHAPWDFGGSLKSTKAEIQKGTQTLFEAAFDYQGCFSKADIIKFNIHSNRWIIYEVKSTTKLKDEHLVDIGIQAWIMAKSGLPIEQINIMYLNPAYTDSSHDNLFITEDITSRIREIYPQVSGLLNQIINSLKEEEIPNVDIGPHCLKPNACAFVSHCWKEKNIPELSVFDLPKIGDHKWNWYRQGVVKLDDSRLVGETVQQKRMIENFRTQERIIDVKSIQDEIKKWKFPLFFLDFETISSALPQYPKVKPYQQVPFQFSVHIWENQNSENLKHVEYLHQDKTDPRPQLIKALLKASEGTGDIISYYSPFEKARIEELAAYSEEHRAPLLSLLDRIKDPLPIVRDHIYDFDFKGSFSIKNVAPALLGDQYNYDDLGISDGLEAQRAFRIIMDESTPSQEKRQIVADMLDYCRQDTLVMVELVKWMMDLHE